jgi:hypothetical protein
VEGGVGADGVAGEPASEGVFYADIEEDGSAEDKKRKRGEGKALF